MTQLDIHQASERLADLIADAHTGQNVVNPPHEHLRNHLKVLSCQVNSKDDIYDWIKTFFGKGH